MLEIKNLKVIRGNFNVCLPELFIDDGECAALCGISGSGKSTLMEAIGLLTPALSVEEFVLDDIEVDMLSSGDSQALRISDIGIMPQTGGLLPYLTIEENLRLQIRLALRQKVTPIFKNPPAAKPSPNTRVVLQEAEERAAARRAALEADSEKAAEAALSGANAAAEAISLRGEQLSGESALTLTSQALSGADRSGADGPDSRDGSGVTHAQGAAGATSADHSWLDLLSDESDSLDGNHAYSGAYEQLSNPHDQINARTGTVPEAVRKESRIPYVRGDDRYSRTLKITNESNSLQIEHYMLSLAPYIERLQLTDHMNKRPDQLSIGQRQRALFLRAIAHKPSLLLIDEPTSSLDPDNAGNLFQLIDEIAQETRVSVLLVTHDLTAASRYRRYVYDRKASHSNYSVFTGVSDEPEKEIRTAGSDGQFMSGQAIDFPAASNLSQKVHGPEAGGFDENMRNQVYRSEEKGFHEIRTSADQVSAGDIVDELYRGYGGSYDQFSLSGQNQAGISYEMSGYSGSDDYTAGFGGRRQINDRVTHYTTSLERLQARIKSHNAAQAAAAAVAAAAGGTDTASAGAGAEAPAGSAWAQLYTGAPAAAAVTAGTPAAASAGAPAAAAGTAARAGAPGVRNNEQTGGRS